MVRIILTQLGRDITLYGSGQQTCPLCYVDDLTDGIVRLMEGPANVADPIGEVDCNVVFHISSSG